MAEGTAVSGYGTDLAGTLANRPTNAPAGVTYYATDTEEFFVSQGSGDNWDEIFPDLVAAAGDAGSGTTAGGAGDAVTIAGGAGGAKADTGAAAGGAGGATTLTGGVGGATASSGSNNGGAGGGVTLTGGAGGAASAGTGDGGAGGDITLTPGAGGATTGGAAGAKGDVKVSGAPFLFGNAQVIDMADAAVVLTRVPGTPAGTELTSNVLAVDANSGATEDLTLPPEADCNGLLLLINNTGGESIVVKNDGGSTIDTVATAEFGLFFCDGTNWVGQNKA